MSGKTTGLPDLTNRHMLREFMGWVNSIRVSTIQHAQEPTDGLNPVYLGTHAITTPAGRNEHSRSMPLFGGLQVIGQRLGIEITIGQLITQKGARFRDSPVRRHTQQAQILRVVTFNPGSIMEIHRKIVRRVQVAILKCAFEAAVGTHRVLPHSQAVEEHEPESPLTFWHTGFSRIPEELKGPIHIDRPVQQNPSQQSLGVRVARRQGLKLGHQFVNTLPRPALPLPHRVNEPVTRSNNISLTQGSLPTRH